ncbi:cytochrome P450 family protein [Rhizoctonia solani AG-3 Rhs1AP]|uniref:Cytochrome P450 family protein n=2 Tax=Rhizoctonia solani AG-3 TaxID=1086053 RepID=A0A074SUG1_9AGAM|nr:cytochrome P450 family protein [Rhizoctonia solani AG-3 Rhs1AP]KEP53557.1 cytochrome P450 family protein [Rhizoctonia solani 123E]
MWAYNISYFNPLLQQFAIWPNNQVYYVVLSILGITGAIVLSRAMSTESNISALAGPAPSSMVWGSTPEMFDAETGLEFQDQLMNTYGSACRVKGPFGANELWISDPRAFQEILIKGYDDFIEPHWFTTWMKLIFGPVVATVYGHQHKVQRKVQLSQLVENVKAEVQAGGDNDKVVDIFKWVHLVALEMIGQAGIGHSFGILEGNVPDYLHASRDMLWVLAYIHRSDPANLCGSSLMMEMWYLLPFITFLSRLGPAFFRRAVVELTPHHPVQRMKNVVDTMHKTVVEIMKRKRRALESGTLDSEVAAGKDIMTALLRQNLVVPPQDQMTDEEVLAQVNGLTFAGHDTTSHSSALSRTISLLAEHQEVQDKLRDEVHQAYDLYGKNLDYDQLNSLSYLDAVCRESLRLYLPGTFIVRVATKDWNLPLQYPVSSKDGRTMVTSIHVAKGTNLYLSLQAANKDAQTWGEDAEDFKPDRWLMPLPTSVTNSRMPGIYSSVMTFSGGPRACPGVKFSQLEMKIILASLVSSFKFELSKDAIKWKAGGIVKPYAQYLDGTTSDDPMMPMKVTVLGSTE